MSNDEPIDLESTRLSDLFDKGWQMQLELEKASDERSDIFVRNRRRTIEILERCEFMLDELALFSENESLDEMSTSEIRYFLNSALVAWLYSKVPSTSPASRLVDLEKARTLFIKYLNVTKSYDLHKFNVNKLVKLDQQQQQAGDASAARAASNVNSQAAFDSNMVSHAYERAEKIRRFKEQKELETALNAFNAARATNVNIDDEDRREFMKKYVKYWINKSLDELKMVNDEINILKSIELEKQNKADIRASTTAGGEFSGRLVGGAGIGGGGKEKESCGAMKKPFIITKNALQAKVFGAGYPSLPVYSIDEFYDQLADKGMMPKHEAPSDERYEPVKIGGGVTESQKANEKAEKDVLEDKHDEAELRKQREWDEFKDENKRGAGNRFNRS